MLKTIKGAIKEFFSPLRYALGELSLLSYKREGMLYLDTFGDYFTVHHDDYCSWLEEAPTTPYNYTKLVQNKLGWYVQSLVTRGTYTEFTLWEKR